MTEHIAHNESTAERDKVIVIVMMTFDYVSDVPNKGVSF